MEREPAIDVKRLLSERPWVHALARSIVGDDHAADDVTQQTFLAALDRPPKHAAALAAWLARVTRNFALRSRRDSSTRRRHEVRGGAARWTERERSGGSEAEVDVVARTEAHHRIVGAVLELDEPYRSTIIEHFFQGETPIVIARRRGVPAATVRSQLKRGIDRLRGTLRPDSGSPWSPAMLALAAGVGVALVSRPAMVAARWGVTVAAAALLYLAYTSMGEPTPRVAGNEPPSVSEEQPPLRSPDTPGGDVALVSSTDEATESASPDRERIPATHSDRPSGPPLEAADSDSPLPLGAPLHFEIEMPRVSRVEYWFIGEAEVWTDDCELFGPWLGALSSRVIPAGDRKIVLPTRCAVDLTGEQPKIAALVQLIPLDATGAPLPEVHYWAAETTFGRAPSSLRPVTLRRSRKPHECRISVASTAPDTTFYLSVSAAGTGAMRWPLLSPTVKAAEPLSVRRIPLPSAKGRVTVGGLPRAWVVVDRITSGPTRVDHRGATSGVSLHFPKPGKGTRRWRGMNYTWRSFRDLRSTEKPVPYQPLPNPIAVPRLAPADWERAQIFVRTKGRDLRARGWMTRDGWRWESSLVRQESNGRAESRFYAPSRVGTTIVREAASDDEWRFEWEPAPAESYLGCVQVAGQDASLPLIVSARTRDRWYGAWHVVAHAGQFNLEEVSPLETKVVHVEVDTERLADELVRRTKVASPLEVRVYPGGRTVRTAESNLGTWEYEVWVGHADHWLPLADFLRDHRAWDAEVGTRERRFEER